MDYQLQIITVSVSDVDKATRSARASNTWVIQEIGHISIEEDT